MNLEIISRLPLEHHEALEQLFYFHPEQNYFHEDIWEQVLKSGSPKIITNEEYLSIQLPKLLDAQILFALDKSAMKAILVGVMIFNRADTESLEMLHIAVLPQFTHSANGGHAPIAVMLVNELCRIAKRIRGVKQIQLAYNRGIISLI